MDILRLNDRVCSGSRASCFSIANFQGMNFPAALADKEALKAGGLKAT